MAYSGLYVLGFGGHARSVADVALAAGVKCLLFVDANAMPDEEFAGFSVVSSMPHPASAGWAVFPALGDNLRRRQALESAVLHSVVLVSPTSTIGRLAEIGEGTFVGHHAHVGPSARVGRGVIINTGAIVEHECEVGAFSHISVNAIVAGRSRIGSNVLVGAGATVIDGIRVCNDVVIGAGATVVDHIVATGTYIGTPARLMRS
ncbi:NeuD/PglB/VioB family sugar acetyltransferase [Mesorhizobium sp. NZP2077]|uniref:NeuD/PglB/VioB family sugar acetyltransferase n=1 Tax=Mesorhizobium sp. NZP2077 TaxID=2483404 RepID=UPI001551A5E8|nr:NeuD/PglB/VioB family sugar acetyltransferase [Mesorhizobium sp. NZP2077]QKC86533.1 acetyltransferase [Mesorhizobium sp. NZP2077]QKD18454.1 acetyltransferase [Mesorhizobium sp. NZP2077]